MNILFLFLLGWLTPLPTYVIQIDNIHDSKGSMNILIFKNAEGFPDDASQAIRKLVIPVQKNQSSMLLPITELPVGDYAIAILHDKNLDGKINTNFLGIPTEGFGFSNNAKGLIGPPSFEKSKIKLNASGGTITIKLTYY